MVYCLQQSWRSPSVPSPRERLRTAQPLRLCTGESPAPLRSAQCVKSYPPFRLADLGAVADSSPASLKAIAAAFSHQSQDLSRKTVNFGDSLSLCRSAIFRGESPHIATESCFIPG